MHGYTSVINIRHPDHHTLQQCRIPGCKPFYNCLGNCCSWVKQRYLISVLTAFGLTISYMQRMCLSILMTEMVSVQKERKGDFCPAYSNITKDTAKTIEHQFDWSISTQGYILAAFFYGYFITHIPGGIISDLFGGKHLFGAVVLLSSACSAVSPMAAHAGPIWLLNVRLVMGLIQGPIFPVITTLVAHWAPPDERGFMNTICNSGVPMGLVLGNLLSGALLGFFKNWEYPFYIYAAMGAVWFLFWLVVASPSPMSHPYITNKEADMIIESIMAETRHEGHGGIPWCSILTDRRFIVATLANLGHETGLFFIATELPIYMFNVLQVPISVNGIVSSIPWMSMWVGNILFGELSHVLIKKNVLSRIGVRRIFGAICNIIPGLLWVIPVYVGCDLILVTAAIAAGDFFVGGVFCSIRASFLDLSPTFAGICMSIAAGVAGMAGFAVPLMVHWLIGEGTSPEDWRLSFYIICGFIVASTIPYLMFITADVRPWDEGRRPKDDQARK